MDDMFIDVSMNPDYDEIEIGDLVVIDIEAFESNGKVIGKALDDRACAVISLLVAKQLSKFSQFPDVYFVFTSREEVGGMGARVAAQGIQPDIGIAMDVTHAHKRTGIELGKGPAITVGGPNIHKGYFKMLDDVAKREGIKVQYEIAAGRTGTDADNVQIAGTGIPTLLVSLPNKFMHTPVEVVQISDVEESARLLVNFLVAVEEGEKMKLERLKDLSELPGISGFEEKVADYIEEKIKDKVDKYWRDNVGNLIALKKGKEVARSSCFWLTWMKSGSWSRR